MDLGPSTFISGGARSPTFCLNVASLSNTTIIGSSDKVNRSIKKIKCFRILFAC